MGVLSHKSHSRSSHEGGGRCMRHVRKWVLRLELERKRNIELERVAINGLLHLVAQRQAGRCHGTV